MGKLLVKVIRCEDFTHENMPRLVDRANSVWRERFPNAVPKSFRCVSQEFDGHTMTVTFEVTDRHLFSQLDSALTDGWLRATGGRCTVTTPAAVGRRPWWA